jgi:hypothetical protein
MCNGLVVPIVAFEQIYSFDVETLMKALPKLKKIYRGKLPDSVKGFVLQNYADGR